jgi:hypothetical protein
LTYVVLQKVCSRVACAPRVRIARERAGEKKLAAGKFIANLGKLVVSVLSSHAQRVLSNDPGKIVDDLVDLVVYLKGAAGWIAKSA